MRELISSVQTGSGIRLKSLDMAETYDLGRAFVHTIRLQPQSRRVHLATTHEVDEPFRLSRSLILRLWGSKGVVLGWWRDTDRSEEQALLDALHGQETDVLDEDGFLLPQYEVEDV